MTDQPFWETTPLDQMTLEQWESLCDGCAKCCLLKLEDEDTGEVAYTNIACRQLDLGNCRCMNYERRAVLVPDCITITPELIERLEWMPKTCAYRRVHEGKSLAWWHPLISGSNETVHEAGISARGRVVSERKAKDPEDYIVEWPEEDIP